LHTCFKELHGVTLFAFGRGLRLDHGQQLLLDTRLTVREIAEQCGYPEQANFTAAFRKRFGVAPSQLRIGKAV
jgi:AraC-like DNA-binding protein